MLKAIRLIEPKKIVIQEIPKPKIMTLHRKTVRVKATGICVSDTYNHTGGEVARDRIERTMTIGPRIQQFRHQG